MPAAYDAGRTADFGNPIVLNEESGLPSSYISTAIPDKQGFIWLGTANGLVRFDGAAIKGYQSEEGDTSSLMNNMINTLFFDSDGQLWAGTDAGASVMDIRQGALSEF